jgi:hypothetical protein
LRSLAYDPVLFERSVELLRRAATDGDDAYDAKDASETFVSLFPIHLSGTHATIEQRLSVIERCLRSGQNKTGALGLAALDAVLEATHFSSGHQFDFGAWSRDFGFAPQSSADVTRWYGAAFALVERLAITEGVLKPDLLGLLARNFRGLWTSAQMYDELERLSHVVAADGFWREGWSACRQTIQFDMDRLTPEAASRLSALEADLRPSNLPERVRAMALGNSSGGLDLDDMDVDGDSTSPTKRLEEIVRELGREVAVDEAAFAELLPDLLRGGNRAWAFGRGLAGGSRDPRRTWAMLVEGLERIALEQRDVQVLRGFLIELWEHDRDLAQSLLDSALDQPVLHVFLPVLHSAIKLDERGVGRLKRALVAGQTPVQRYRDIAFGRATDHLAGGILKDLLLLIADQPEGFDVALEILYMRLFSDRSDRREYEPELIETGRELLRLALFQRNTQRGDHELASVAKACLTGLDAGPIAADVAVRLRQAVAAHKTNSFENDELLKSLLEVQPIGVLDALFGGSEADQRAGVRVFDRLSDHQGNPADAISCETLVAWCEQNPERRYPIAASIVTYVRRTQTSDPQVWSEQARALLTSTSDPRSVLAVLVARFRPMSWSGSRAALMEANARLLDSLESHDSSDLSPFVAEVKAQLAQEIARERQRETNDDRERDERFE